MEGEAARKRLSIKSTRKSSVTSIMREHAHTQQNGTKPSLSGSVQTPNHRCLSMLWCDIWIDKVWFATSRQTRIRNHGLKRISNYGLGLFIYLFMMIAQLRSHRLSRSSTYGSYYTVEMGIPNCSLKVYHRLHLSENYVEVTNWTCKTRSDQSGFVINRKAGHQSEVGNGGKILLLHWPCT